MKLRLALGLALIVAVLTAGFGLMHGVRPLTVLYRTFISLLVFAVGGYILGSGAELLLARWLAGIKPKGQNVDIVSEDDGLVTNDELIHPSHAAQPFSPLDPNELERLSTKE